jgi:hypothetical protein
MFGGMVQKLRRAEVTVGDTHCKLGTFKSLRCRCSSFKKRPRAIELGFRLVSLRAGAFDLSPRALAPRFRRPEALSVSRWLRGSSSAARGASIEVISSSLATVSPTL